MQQVHTFAPVFDDRSRILILGTFPSVKSRENAFYYGHPQNRFWKVLAALWQEPVPETIPEKTAFLLRHYIALWDVVERCDIIGSSDSSIKNVVPNDIGHLLSQAPVGRLFANGKTAEALYHRYVEPTVGRKIQVLPSTSPANAAWTLPRLVEQWQCVRTAAETPVR